MQLITFAWTTDNPNAVEHAALSKPDAEVPAYVDALDKAAREQGFSYATYDAGVLPRALLRYYAADLKQGGTRCEHAQSNAWPY